jgi:thiamine pyrophosphate-dependent acetolactate synthase large subunit-like protein
MKVHEGLAAAIAAENCRTIFSLMGDANLTTLDAFARDPAHRIISARNEAGAVAMADGYFRATGEVGVATITCGPGLTQTGTSLVAASRNASAVVVVTGDTPQHWPIKLQLLDQPRFAAACEVRYQNVVSAATLADDVAEAFYAARLLLRPVILSLPLDMLDDALAANWQYQPARGRHAAAGRLVPDGEAITRIADELAQAARPVLVAGRGAVLSGARETILSVAKRTGALLGTTLLARGMFSGEELDIGIVGGFSATPTRHLLAEADYVLAIGAELGYFTTQSGSLFPKARIVRIDIAPLPWSSGIPAGYYVQGDAKKSVEEIDRQLTSRKIIGPGYRSAATQSVLQRRYELPPRANDGIDPRRLMLRLSETLSKGMVVTSGVGHYWSFPSMYLDLPDGVDMRFAHQFGSVGQALPVAIGQAVAEPDKLHLVIEGDASLMMNIQELETAARHKLPLIVLVFNDSGLGAEVHKLNRKGYNGALASFPSPDFVTIARGMGGAGMTITQEDEIAAAMRAARDAGGLFVIDARISPTTMSDPYLRTHYGQDVQTPLIQGRQGASLKA